MEENEIECVMRAERRFENILENINLKLTNLIDYAEEMHKRVYGFRLGDNNPINEDEERVPSYILTLESIDHSAYLLLEIISDLAKII